MSRGIPAYMKPPDLEPVPTLVELHAKGLADIVARNASREPTHYRPTTAGQQLIYDVMGRNAARYRAAQERRSA